MPRFSAIQTHLSCRFRLALDVPGLRRSGSWSQIINQLRIFRNGSLGTATSANWNVTLRPWLTTLAPILTGLDRRCRSSPQRGQRPVLDFLRQRQRPHEVGDIVGEGVNLRPDGVVAELEA